MQHALILLNGFINWLETHLLTCPVKKYLHIDCPGCGLQRSMVALLKGNVTDSLKLYPATLPLVFLFVFTIAHLIFKFRKGSHIIKWMYIAIACIILGFYIFKVVTHKNI